VYFERMKARSLYTTEEKTIRERVHAAGFSDVFAGR
jgi:hypothetical protein